MARIPYYEPASKSAEFSEYFSNLGALGKLRLFQMMAHSEHLTPGIVDMGKALLYRGTLNPVLREIVIIRVGRLCGCAYEVFQHERNGRRSGLSEAMIDALRDGSDAPFSDLQRLVLGFTDEVVKNVKASDATFAAVHEALGHETTVELIIMIGYYMMVSRFLETMEVDGEVGQAEWVKTANL